MVAFWTLDPFAAVRAEGDDAVRAKYARGRNRRPGDARDVHRAFVNERSRRGSGTLCTERAGFEPATQLCHVRDFQSRSLDHSDTSPRATTLASAFRRHVRGRRPRPSR